MREIDKTNGNEVTDVNKILCFVKDEIQFTYTFKRPGV